jgi:hypothetical protein
MLGIFKKIFEIIKNFSIIIRSENVRIKKYNLNLKPIIRGELNEKIISYYFFCVNFDG